MNFKTTFALLLLAVGIGVLVWKGKEFAPEVGLTPPPAPKTAGKTADILASIKPDTIQSVTVRTPGSVPVELRAEKPGQPLELPGNWPIRRGEVEELLATITGISSRFHPIPLKEGDLSSYGLNPSENPLVVDVRTKKGNHTLTFGEASAVAGENPFGRAVFVRVDEEPEVLQIGADLLPILRRPADFYRKRQLFPDSERVRIADSSKDTSLSAPSFILTDAVQGITVEGPSGGYQLKRIAPTPKPATPLDKPVADAVVVANRLADAWQIVAPFSDRADPIKLKSVLMAIPDLWVDQFLTNPDPLLALAAVAPIGLPQTPALALSRPAIALAIGSDLSKEGPFLQRAGLIAAPMKLTLTMADGSKRTLSIGKTTRITSKVEPSAPPMAPGQPPPPPKITEEKHYYAKLNDNPLLFEVAGERLKNIFFNEAKPPEKKDIPGELPEPPARAFDQLRDTSLARFDADQVVSVKVQRPGQTLELRKTKGNPKAETEEARQDRWDLIAPFTGLAEANQVTGLLTPLESLAAKKGEIIERPLLHLAVGGLATADLQLLSLTPELATTVTITADPRLNLPPRTILVGAHDEAKKKLAMITASEPGRINVVEDNAFQAIARQPRAYRALKLFDLGDDRVESIEVRKPKEQYRLQENVEATETTFAMTQPVKAKVDQTKAKDLFAGLGSLEAVEYVFDPLSKKEKQAVLTLLGGWGEKILAAATNNYGLDQPSAVATIHFAGPKAMAARTLSIGKQRVGKDEYYAQLDSSPTVFAIKKDLAESLTNGPLGILPLQLWNGSVDGLSQIEIQRGQQPAYQLALQNGLWKIVKPFAVDAEPTSVLPLAVALSALKADRYVALQTVNLAEYGLDQPAERIKFTLTESTVDKPGEEPRVETKERTLLIGKPTSDGAPGHYAKLDGNGSIFVLNEAIWKEMDHSALDLVSKRLLNVPANAVTQIETSGPQGSLTLQKDANGWKPVGTTFPVDMPTVDGLLRLVANLNALKFADYGDTVDWAKYGLNADAKPLTFSLKAGDKTHKLEIGKVVEGTPNDRFARIDGGKGVAVLPVTVTRDLNKSKLDFVDRTIFKFDPIDLQGIRRTVGDKKFELALVGSSWEMVEPKKLPADQGGMEELADQLGKLRAERVAEVDGKDLAKFGLDKPAASVTLEVIGKGAKVVEKKLKLGAPVDAMKPDGDRYVQSEGTSTVVVLAGGIARKLLADPLKFRERSIANFVTADKIVITRNGQDATFEKADGVWKLTKPVASAAEDETLRELHDGLARLRAEEIVAEKPSDLKQFGLDQPEHWRLFNGDKEVLSLLVGKRETLGANAKEQGFRAYAKLEKGDLVFLLNMNLTSKLAGEYRKRALWEPLDVAQATQIRVQRDDGSTAFHFIKTPAGWLDQQSPMSKLNQDKLTDFLDAFASLKAGQFIEHQAKNGTKLYGLDPAQKQITVATQNGQRVLYLGRVDESKRVYAKLEGKDEVFVLSPEDTAKINRDRFDFYVDPPKKQIQPPKKEVVSPKKEPEPKKAPVKESEPKKEAPKPPEEPKKESSPKQPQPPKEPAKKEAEKKK